jgi:hypothetical protein
MNETGQSTVTIPPYQKRVIDEKNQLDEKRSLLEKFFESEIFKGLSDDDQVLLNEQFQAMNRYSEILGKRIVKFFSLSNE